MALTGLALLALSVAGTVCAMAGLGLVWQRLGRWRVPARTLGILACNVLAVWCLALAVNRAGDFYPSWRVLLDPPVEAAAPPVAPLVPARLAPELAARATVGATSGVVLPWRPSGLGAWRLQSTPLVYVPPAYYRQPWAALPVVVVLSPTSLQRGRWAGDGAAARDAVVVLLRPRAGAPAWAASLARELRRDFGVAQHCWALVAAGTAATVAVAGAHADARRYCALGLVGSVPQGAVASARRLDLPVRVEGLAGALRWAYDLLPAALAGPATVPAGPVPVGT